MKLKLEDLQRLVDFFTLLAEIETENTQNQDV